MGASVGAVDRASERADHGSELLEDDRLDLDLANLLKDDPKEWVVVRLQNHTREEAERSLFGNLDEDGKTLLDYGDLF